MATPRRRIDDGILDGHLVAKLEACDNCGEDTWPFEIDTISLPKGVKPSNKLIVFREGPNGLEAIDHIGFGCGCYGKFHRQIAHIKDQVKK